MKKLRIWATVALTLGILSLVLLFLMVLALADIYHGEGNVSAEWGLLQLGFFVIFFLIIATSISAGRVLKRFHRRGRRTGPGSA